MSDVVERAKAALEGVEAIGGPIWVVGGDDPRDNGCRMIGDPDPEGAGLIGEVGHVVAPFVVAARSLVPELVAEVESLRLELALARDGFHIRPLTETESNLMTQVLKLRRRIADADELHRVELRQLQIKHEQDVIKAHQQ